MKRVATGELEKRLRTCATGQLTENPERQPLGVLAFQAKFLQEFTSAFPFAGG